MKILALDFETGGTDPNRHAPIQLGVAVMEGDDVLASKEWIIGPKRHYKTGKIEREYDVNALAISGIPWKAILDAPSPSDIAGELFKFTWDNEARELPIVAFNASFDHSFYSTLLFLAGGMVYPAAKFSPAAPSLLGGWHCAMLKTRAKMLGLDDYKLDTVAAYFGLSREGEKHGALEDAILAGRIWERLTA